jgi:hypothetical protein
MMSMTMSWSGGTWTPAGLTLGNKVPVVERDELIKATRVSSCGATEGVDRSRGAADLFVEEGYWHMVYWYYFRYVERAKKERENKL